MSSYRITETKQPTIQQVTEYITDDNWMSFLTRHMDVIDEKKTFKDQPNNIAAFTNFICRAFNLFIKENILDEDVKEDVKNLNHLTVDIKVYLASGKDVLQQIDIRSLLNLNSQ